MIKSFDWREVHEGPMAAGWGLCLLTNLWLALMSDLPSSPFLVITAISLFMFASRLMEAWRLWNRKLSLLGKTLEFVPPKLLANKMKEGAKIKDGVINYENVWLGWGYEWKIEHSQSVYDFKGIEISDFMPPLWFQKMYGKIFDSARASDLGAAWVHGLEPKEKPIFVPVNYLQGHTLILGVTGSGKTRLFDLLIMQAVLRGDTVIVIDPKGDKEMRLKTENACKIACKIVGREDNFRFFHPAFTNQSVRIDPLKNFGNVTELASRVAALIPSESGSDAFKSFGFRVLNVIAEGLLESGQSPTLKKLKKYIEGGPEGLLQTNLELHLSKNVGDWERRAAVYIDRASNGSYKSPSPQATTKLVGMVAFFQQEANVEAPSEILDKLISMYQHSREHFGKMIANLLPVLDMLTSGELGKLLSPDPDDLNDDREIIDSQQIISQEGVVYMGLNSLADSTVASAIGSMMLSDLAATAGQIYNYRQSKPVSIFVDEGNEVANDPFIQILNKGRGAGFRTTVATQTISDFYARLGSQDKGSMVLGNFNNYIAQRITDRVTQEFISQKFGEVYIESMERSISTSGKSNDSGTDFTGTEGAKLKKEMLPKIPVDLFGQIPNLQFFALLVDGKLIKGRLPIVEED